jgi:hypothetical protein
VIRTASIQITPDLLNLIAEIVTALGRRLAKGPKLRQEFAEDVAGGPDES